jgi:hypothetical protein
VGNAVFSSNTIRLSLPEVRLIGGRPPSAVQRVMSWAAKNATAWCQSAAVVIVRSFSRASV